MRTTPAFIDKLVYLSVMALIASLAYAVPALWDFIAMKMELPRSAYLLKPVENQRYYLQIATFSTAILCVILRFVSPSGVFRRNSIVYLAAAFLVLAFCSALNSRS